MWITKEKSSLIRIMHQPSIFTFAMGKWKDELWEDPPDLALDLNKYVAGKSFDSKRDVIPACDGYFAELTAS